MKRNPLLICLLMVFAVYISGTAQAQTVQPLPKQEKYSTAELNSNSTGQLSKEIFESWFLPYLIYGPNGLNKVANGSIFTLFPDTTVLIRFIGSQQQDTLSPPFYHSVGNVWDLRSDAYVGNPFNIDSTYTYTLDSVDLSYQYIRWNEDPNIVDTLLFQIYYDSAAFTSIRNTGISGNDVALGNITYDYTKNRGVASKRDIKVPLTFADTAAGIPGSQPGTLVLNKSISAFVGAMINGNSRVAVTVNYIPGQAYSLAAPYDTLEADSSTINRLNQFKVLRLNFTEIYKESTSTQNPAKNRRYNNGLFISSDIRGNNSAGGWNGTYYPGIYGNATTFMDIRIKITADDHKFGIGMNDINADGYAMGNAYPNPTNGQDVNLNFSIAKSQPVTLTLSNILGQTIRTATESFTNGTHTISVNTSNLEAGVYFYTLSSGTFSQTKKLTVSK